MRMMMKVAIPIQAANRAKDKGLIGPLLKKALETLRPESTYFYPGEGTRNMLFVIDVKDSSDLPLIGEPFFHDLEAAVDFFPVMNLQDFQTGLKKLAEQPA